MALIYLVRHGQAGAGMGAYDDGNVEKSYDGLTERGRRQAHVVARSLVERLGSDGGDDGSGTDATDARTPRVFCGPLHRQHDTAAAVSSALFPDRPTADPGTDPATDPAWKEFDSDAVVVPWMKRNTETARWLRQVMQDVRHGSGDVAEAESAVREVLDGALGEWIDSAGFQEFRETVLGGLGRATAAAREDGAAVVATSAGVIATCTAAVSGLPRQAVPSLVGRIFNASVTVLRVADEAGRHRGGSAGVDLLSFNEYAHLDRPDARGDLTLI
ncbi:histidine phosphatase family protein [Corynebacterium glyciniphilum]|uniref:histidine phosphatase family protein n=1 Tax=Corynebacterium glyciniphilum TaxID=1404244 RepID=UPI00264BD6BB|nr:histidine phosphatase family protein [Corynebacterium glyciniphilum]MDN5683127.1 histidine phosphatase family protein [Corynebacterium glyciniphilum]MDN6706823.1 histidine phosphatase family protein [Corynebacterium glyciniphilum]